MQYQLEKTYYTEKCSHFSELVQLRKGGGGIFSEYHDYASEKPQESVTDTQTVMHSHQITKALLSTLTLQWQLNQMQESSAGTASSTSD